MYQSVDCLLYATAAAIVLLAVVYAVKSFSGGLNLDLFGEGYGKGYEDGFSDGVTTAASEDEAEEDDGEEEQGERRCGFTMPSPVVLAEDDFTE